MRLSNKLKNKNDVFYEKFFCDFGFTFLFDSLIFLTQLKPS
jgi:hypothetical protein